MCRQGGSLKYYEGIKLHERVLRSEVMSINNNTRATKAPSTCHIYVSCKTPRTAPDLPLLLGCPVLYASRVGSQFSWKVKIHRHSLYDALRSLTQFMSGAIIRSQNLPPPLPPTQPPLLQRIKIKQLPSLLGIAEASTTASIISSI